jgi:MFS family permease
MEQEKTSKPILPLSLLSLFIISMVVLGLEILLTRVFAVVLFSSHSFMAISLALLGTGSGAAIAYLGKSLTDEQLKLRIVLVLALTALIIVLSLFIMLQLEFVPLEVENPITGEVEKNLSYKKRAMMLEKNPQLFDTKKLYSALPMAFLPFLLAGYLQALIFRATPRKFSKLYGIDLIGATVGSLTIPTLLYPLGLIGTIGMVMILCLVPIGYAFLKGLRSKTVVAAMVIPILVFITLIISGQFRVHYSAGFREKDVIRDYWSPFARVALVDYKGRETYIIDNASRTYYAPDTKKFRKKYAKSLYTIPFSMKRGGDMLIIASGGGQEITQAHRFDFKNIDAVEIAGPIVRDILKVRKDDPNNPYLLEGVVPHIADGRSVAMRAKNKFDIIQMLEVNCWTLAGQISQAWSPYFVFTQEAFSEYFAHLKKDGFLCYTIFSNSENPISGNKGRRVRSVIAGLRMAGIKNPKKHIAILQRPYVYGSRTMVMAKRTPFKPEELQALYAGTIKNGKKSEILFPKLAPFAKKVSFDVPEGKKLQPTKRYIKPILALTKNVRPITGLMGTFKERNNRTRPISDDCPYAVGSGMRRNAPPSEKFIGDLYRVLLKVMTVLTLIFIVMPFVIRRPGGSEKVRIDPRLLMILVLTGFGFMLIEMAGIFRFQLYLHHPIMAMILVLSSMILGAGLGSLHTAKIPDDKKEKAIAKYALITVVGSLVLMIAVPQLGHSIMLSLPLPVLGFLTFAVFCSLGFIMGHIVPLSISVYTQGQENLIAWCWAITVTGSVFGTVLASILARDFGMALVTLLGVSTYVAIALINLVGGWIARHFGKANVSA